MIRAALSGLALMIALSGCAPVESASTTETASLDCSVPDGWVEVASRDADFVVFGETHGSNEAPDLVSELVCALALQDEPVLLAVEHSSIYNLAFQQAWDGSAEDLPAAMAAAGWLGRQDGVASEAMLQLVQRAHALKVAGHAVSIVAFNGARDDEQRERFAQLPSQGPHEAAQAENIAEAAAAADYAHVIVLVGNLHAQKQPAQMGGEPFEPMAMRLAQYGEVISLGMHSAGGETWNCQLREDYELVPGEPITSDAITCGAYAFRGDAALERAPFVALGDFPASPFGATYDGYFWIGRATASPPAFPE